jgi:D-glycero-D-manno-heptose 1,7-bisphosphate phosphatase
MTSLHRAVFLDRDGVLNVAPVRDGKPYPPSSLEELVIADDAEAALRALRDLGFYLIVITNQPDVTRGKQERALVELMHDRLRRELPLDDILTCFHDDADQCQCRKPKPGLVLEAAQRYQISLAQSFFIGDRWRDVECGHQAGCTTILIDRQYRERKAVPPPDHKVRSLKEAADLILQGARRP